MSRGHWPSDHITGMITPVGWTTDAHITGMITVNTKSPRSCRRSGQPPGLLGNTAAAAATDPAGSKTGGRNPMSRTTPRAENASTRSMPRSWPNARSTKRDGRVNATHGRHQVNSVLNMAFGFPVPTTQGQTRGAQALRLFAVMFVFPEIRV